MTACTVCGEPFEAADRRVRICPACKKNLCKAAYPGRRSRKNKETIEEIQKKAAAEGTSYGKYVVKHDL